MVSINEKIKELRISKGVKQSEVARSAGIKQSSYASIENGDTKSISVEVGKGIAKVLEVSFCELFEIDLPIDHEKKKLKEENEELRKLISMKEELIKIQSEAIELYKQGYLEAKKVHTISERISMIAQEELSKSDPKNITYEELQNRVGKRFYKEIDEIPEEPKADNMD